VRTPAFGVGVRARRPWWDIHHVDAGRGEYRVERGGELRVSVPNQVPEPVRLFIQVHQQVAGLLGHPGPGGVGGDPQQVHRPAVHFDDEQYVQPWRRRIRRTEVADTRTPRVRHSPTIRR
jgi:hypothetical protein